VRSDVALRVLGPMEADVGGTNVDLGGPHQRTVLAVLTAARQGVVSLDRLADVLWGERPPPSATVTIRAYLSRLRRLLEPDREPGGASAVLVGVKPGYVLRLDDDRVDAWRFERLLEEAQQLAGIEPAKAYELVSDALRMWRGPAFAEFADQHWALADCVRLNELRLAASLLKLALRLRLGATTDAVAEAESLVHDHPLAEEAWRLLAVALWADGRQADALGALRRCRTRLVDEMGLDPGPTLRKLEHAILTDDTRPLAEALGRVAVAPEPADPGWIRAAPRQLPAAIAAFTGRTEQQQRLNELIDRTGGPQPRPAVAVVSGTAGIGKTALVIHWGHQVADRFPDGQLYADLRGFEPDAQPSTPDEVLHGFLSALHVPPQQVPIHLQACVGLYRSLLAGRRMLVVLDNARDASQVRPLIPGTPECLTVVTSRDQLPGLVAAGSAHPIVVGLPSRNEARRLLAARLGNDRVETEPDAVDAIIEWSGRLPLALSVLAARAATRTHTSLAALAAEWHTSRAEGRPKLDALETGDPTTDLRSVFACSYHALGPSAARLFRLLGLHPGGGITTPAAASIAAVPASTAHRLLSELTDSHVLTEHRPSRYRQHDLLREYAMERARMDDTFADRRAAARRLLDHYLHASHAAARLLQHAELDGAATPVAGTVRARFTSATEALEWMSTEHQTLVALVGFAARNQFDVHAWQLAACTSRLMNRRGLWHDSLTIQRIAVAAAERLDDPGAQALSHLGLARANVWLRDDDEARTQFAAALALYERLDDRRGQGAVHLNLHWMTTRSGDHQAALRAAYRARDLFRRTGDRGGEGNALNSAGWSLAQLGEVQRAVAHCRRAVALLDDGTDARGLAQALDSLGFVQHRLGRHDDATSSYRRSLGLFEGLGDQYPRAETLISLGDVLAATGDQRGARATWRQALDIHRRLGSSRAAQIRERLAALPPHGQPSSRT
jgi:DNA-binding SARP family transcriptional activator/tetratricopeptide (TPR) repeat protein